MDTNQLPETAATTEEISNLPSALSEAVNETAAGTETEKHSYKLTDAEFAEALLVNYGLYAQTARYIERKYGVSFSRQAVQKRAIYFRDLVNQQKETVQDIAQGVLFKAINQEEDLKLQFRASVYLLNKLNQGKKAAI